MMKTQKTTNLSSLLTTQDLSAYFYDRLNDFNKKSLCPMPQEFIFYSGKILEENFHSDTFFEISEGKTRNKILGLKLLESKAKPREEQKRILKEVGDTCLIVSGYFSNSLTKSIVDKEYYYNLGKMAYLELDSHLPHYLDIKSFYRSFASGFENLSRLLNLLASSQEKDPYEHLLLNDLSDEDYLIRGVLPNQSRKVS